MAPRSLRWSYMSSGLAGLNTFECDPLALAKQARCACLHLNSALTPRAGGACPHLKLGHSNRALSQATLDTEALSPVRSREARLYRI